MEVTSIGSKSVIGNSAILKPNYHLNYGKKRIEKALKNGNSFSALGDLTDEVYTGGIFKRVFVDNERFGLPYISAQHMMNSNPLDVAKLISKKYTPRQSDMTLREKQILVSCAGTVGNVRLIGSDLDGIIGSQDIIRIIADESKIPFGFLYAYLASDTAYNYMQSFIYGSVVPRIEPTTLSLLPVPILNKELTDKCNDLIQNSLDSRNRAIIKLNEAVTAIELKLPQLLNTKFYGLKLSKINNYRKRFESTLQINAIDSFYEELTSNGITCETIHDLSESVFTPGIFKRIKVKKSPKSIPYLGGAELLNFRPKLNTYLSHNTKNLEDYILKKGFLTLQDSGSIQSMGYVSIIPTHLDGVAATNNLVRVVPKSDDNYNYYIFAFLQTKQANSMIKRLAYGTGQLHIDTKIVGSLKIPIFPDIKDLVDSSISEYQDMIEKSYKLESEAINIIENEIESWQK